MKTCDDSAKIAMVSPSSKPHTTRKPPDGKLAIIGPTNSGKSLFFNELTTGYSIVANYPQTTITPIRKKISMKGQTVEVIDTPGIAAFATFGTADRETLDVLLRERPEQVLVCGDAMRLKQSLLLLIQVLELGLPTVFCINKVDQAARNGLVIQTNPLFAHIHIPVLQTAIIQQVGLKATVSALASVAVSSIAYPVRYSLDIESLIEKIRQLFAQEHCPSRGDILLFLQADPEMSQQLPARLDADRRTQLTTTTQEFFRKVSPNELKQSLFNVRDHWADRLAKSMSFQAPVVLPGFSQQFAKASRHPLWGWPILLGILWLIFTGVGTVASEITRLADENIFRPLTQLIFQGVPWTFLREMLVGDYGMVTMGLFNALGTVLPILLVFFLIINLLEDIGYLPNLSVLATRTLAPVGLTGKAVLPLILGTGCNTMATLTSRMLETRKERLMATFLIALGIPCAVQLGVMLAILATLPFSALLIVMGTVLTTQIIAGLLLSRMIPNTESAEFILELPNFRWPDWRNIVRKTHHRVKWFLGEALPMFVFAAAMMFTLAKTGLLVKVKYVFHPIITEFLSLPDKVTEVFILVLSRREVGAIFFKNMVDSGSLEYTQIVVVLVVMTLFMPCIENTIMMIRELGMRWAISMNLAIVAIAILVGGLLNSVLRTFMS